MTRVVLDTDILSEVLKGRNHAVAARASACIEEQGRVAITVVTVLEVVSGWRRLQREDRVAGFLERLGDMDVLSFGPAAALIAGRIEGDLARLGQPIGRADSIIAAIVIAEGCTLVTGNTEHYRRLPPLGFQLQLDDWRIR